MVTSQPLSARSNCSTATNGKIAPTRRASLVACITLRRGAACHGLVASAKRSLDPCDLNPVKTLVRAHEWFGPNGIGAIARVEGLDKAYITRVLSLAFLAPKITRAILEGQQPDRNTVDPSKVKKL
jgi:hypothetical protein